MADVLLREPTGARGAYEGVLRFTRVAEGSHSEHEGPALETLAGRVRLYVEGDNPFENASLRAHAGARLSAEGTWRNGVLRVVRVEVLSAAVAVSVSSKPEAVVEKGVSPEAAGSALHGAEAAAPPPERGDPASSERGAEGASSPATGPDLVADTPSLGSAVNAPDAVGGSGSDS